MTGRTIAIAGASGVIGSAAVETFASDGWDVVALSRRLPVVRHGTVFRHVPLDLADQAACEEAVTGLGPVSHLVYAAVAEAPGLTAGWSDPALIARNSQMFTNLAEPLSASGDLTWIGLLQGTKAYGAHLHAIALPARESTPRDPHANFYFEQEDALRRLADRHGIDWTIFRPQIVFGGAPGAAMNPVAAIGAYAALCKQMDLPFGYPGEEAVLWEIADAGLIASALTWAASACNARGETFNLTNGDVFVLKHDWPEISKRVGLNGSGKLETTLADFFSSPAVQDAWRRLAREKRLRIDDLSRLVGESQHYVDLLLSGQTGKASGLPVLVSAIKVRKAGFTDCRDSLDGLLFWLNRMCEMNLLPRDLIGHSD